MSDSSTKHLCMFNVLDGLREGLSHFSGLSRAALVYAEKPQDPIRVYDPQGLLQGHEPKLKELYLDSHRWRVLPAGKDLAQLYHLHPEPDLQLAGLISNGGRTPFIFYQMWFTEHHPDMCHIGPTLKWLEHAVCLLSHDFADNSALYTGSSRYVLREYATHAVRDYLRDELNLRFGWDIRLEIYHLLDAVLGVSKTREEGVRPYGKLAFLEPSYLSDVDYMVRFPRLDRPSLANHKHVRKLLLAVEGSDRRLVSDGLDIVGISRSKMPDCRVAAEFHGSYGFLRLCGDLVCSFSDGAFHSTNRKPKLVELEELLLGPRLDPVQSHSLFKIVTRIVTNANAHEFGCTLVLDLNEQPVEISGQRIEDPLDLEIPANLELAKSLARLDGALHIRLDLRLLGFACLLDGKAVLSEDRARGARFNSALRFSAEHQEIIVVVVSSDRRVSVIQGGIELTAQCQWLSFSEFVSPPPTIEEWLRRSL